jgi:plasmid stabilization system protein ParE
MKRFVLAPEAAEDLQEIWDYIARDNINAADRTIDRIHKNIQKIQKNPSLGHKRQDLVGDRPLLFWSFNNFMLIYRTTKELLEVIAVTHDGRDIPTFLSSRSR